MRILKNPALIPVAVTLACLLPFINKAFHIDDTLFIWAAKHIQANPLDFYGFTVNWYGFKHPMAEVMKNPPLASYYLALFGGLFEWKEVVLHIAYLIPAVFFALGTFYLAKDLCSNPLLASLASILTPVFLVSSTNVMCDTMMATFWIWAVVFWRQGIKEDKWTKLLLGGLLIAVSTLTKYFGMALLPLLILYTFLEKRKLGTWILFLIIPTIILAGYQWATHMLYGRGLLLDAASYATETKWKHGGQLFSHGLTGLSFTGGCVSTALFYFPFLWRRRAAVGMFILSTFLLTLWAFLFGSADSFSLRSVDQSLRWSFLLQFDVMILGGLSILGFAVIDFLHSKDADSLLLVLWVLGTFIFATFINWTVNGRSVLPMVPAAGILLTRRLERTNPQWKGMKAFLLLIAPALLALLVTHADYSWANAARSASKAIRKIIQTRQNGTVWFQGHWGFQYYMESLGTKPLEANASEGSIGDLIVMPGNNSNPLILQKELLKGIDILQFELDGIGTMTPELGAGFYSDLWGPLPFAIGPVDPDKYFIFYVKEGGLLTVYGQPPVVTKEEANSNP
ncbi:MAG: glycosyltransferase family 39 protein [Candidatus Omnitrophica bacterium]|nr:glycosyltransferase family 39 protein [Candidatus Omnitrophota bacterium]